MPFSIDEVNQVVKRLKTNKACGIDSTRNEFIENCPQSVVSLITDFLNLILESGVIPTDWCIGIIVPLYTNKGSDRDPANYRGISLLSCMGKLFTAALNNRLISYLEATGSIGGGQAGFRAEFSNFYYLFTLHSIIDM